MKLPEIDPRLARLEEDAATLTRQNLDYSLTHMVEVLSVRIDATIPDRPADVREAARVALLDLMTGPTSALPVPRPKKVTGLRARRSTEMREGGKTTRTETA